MDVDAVQSQLVDACAGEVVGLWGTRYSYERGEREMCGRPFERAKCHYTLYNEGAPALWRDRVFQFRLAGSCVLACLIGTCRVVCYLPDSPPAAGAVAVRTKEGAVRT